MGKIIEAITLMQSAIEDFEMAKIQINDSKVYKTFESHARSILDDLLNSIDDNLAFNRSIVFPKCEGLQMAFMQPITNPLSPNVDGLFEKMALPLEPETVNGIIDAELMELQKIDQFLMENPFSFDFSTPEHKNIISYKLKPLPVSPMTKAMHINDKGGIEKLRTLFDESNETLKQIHEMWINSDDKLNGENLEDICQRIEYQQKWTLPTFEQRSITLRSNANVYRNFIRLANSAEKSIQDAFNKNMRGIEYLSLLGSTYFKVPVSYDEISNVNDQTIYKLQFTMEYDHFQNKVDSLKAQRHSLQSKLELLRIDLNKQLFDTSKLNKQTIEEAMKPLREDIAKCFAFKEDLCSSYVVLMYFCLTTDGFFKHFGKSQLPNVLANYEMIDSNMINELNEAYDCFTALMANMQESKTFYTELKQMMTTFANEVAKFCSDSKMERENLLKSLAKKPSKPMPSTSSASDNGPSSPNRMGFVVV